MDPVNGFEKAAVKVGGFYFQRQKAPRAVHCQDLKKRRKNEIQQADYDYRCSMGSLYCPGQFFGNFKSLVPSQDVKSVQIILPCGQIFKGCGHFLHLNSQSLADCRITRETCQAVRRKYYGKSNISR